MPHLPHMAVGNNPGTFLVLSKRNEITIGLSDALLTLSLQSTQKQLCSTKLALMTLSHI